jgi:hypothetical protein
LGGQITDFAAIEFARLDFFGGADADFGDQIGLVGLHEKDRIPHFDRAVFDADKNDNAAIGIVVTIEDQGLKGGVGIAFWGRNIFCDFLEDIGDIKPGFRRDFGRFGNREPIRFSISCFTNSG